MKKEVGKLYLNRDGRPALDDWTYFTCGSPIMIKIGANWVKTTIEHDGTRYYAVGYKGLTLPGLTACAC